MSVDDVNILSVGTALPGPPIDNGMLGRRLGMGNAWGEWVDTFVGTKTRYLARDLESGDVQATLSDLGETAAGKAMAAAGIDPVDVDLVVMATAMPEMLMPATVNVIADRLGINDVVSFQIQSGCTGAIQALHLTRQMMVSGGAQTALVIGGDVSAKHFSLSADFTRLPPAQLVNLVVFGDGAGAAVLRVGASPRSVALREVFTRLVGLGRKPGQTLDWFGPDGHQGRPGATEDYKAIEESVPLLAAEVKAELLDRTGWSESEVSYFLPPQLSGRMTSTIVRHLGVPDEKLVNCVEDVGNNGNALVFFQLERALQRLQSGDRALAVAIESSKWIKGGLALEKA